MLQPPLRLPMMQHVGHSDYHLRHSASGNHSGEIECRVQPSLLVETTYERLEQQIDYYSLDLRRAQTSGSATPATAAAPTATATIHILN